MSDLRKAAEIALDSLEEINKLSVGANAICLPAEIDTAMDALRAALAEPEQEPLTDKEIHDCFQQRSRDKTKERRLITRAIERAHGIGGKYER